MNVNTRWLNVGCLQTLWDGFKSQNQARLKVSYVTLTGITYHHARFETKVATVDTVVRLIGSM